MGVRILPCAPIYARARYGILRVAVVALRFSEVLRSHPWAVRFLPLPVDLAEV
jgi:hypothetical protein